MKGDVFLDQQTDNSINAENGPSARQQEVLTAVLDLMVEEGDRFSMASVARRASCSKETLYKWFGDRDGLLTATVQRQASKVAMPELDRQEITLESFRRGLVGFAISWIQVITGDVSAALNQLAISHASSGKSRLGEIVLNNGPSEMARRLKPIFQLGRDAGLIQFDNIDTIFRSYFGLVVADWQIRKLLGEKTRPSSKGIEDTAVRAVDQFLILYGVNEKTNNINV